MHVMTDVAMDWTKVADLLPARNIDLEVLHVDDAARNLHDLRRSELAVVGEAAVQRRDAWRRVAESDPETIALRAVLPLLDALAPGKTAVQDPRLLEVQRIVAAETSFWHEMLATRAAPQVAEPRATEPPPPVGQAPRLAPNQPAEPAAAAMALGESRNLLGCRRWIVARTSFARIRTLCGEVAAHATATAAKANDPVIAAKYRELATRCTAASQAIEAAWKP